MSKRIDLKRIVREELRKVISESEGTFPLSDYFDLSKISQENKLAMMTDMRLFLMGRGFGDRLMLGNKDIIVEGNARTLSVGEVKRKLSTYGFKKWQVKAVTYANNVKIVILYANISKNTETITSEMKSMGWDRVRISEGVVERGVEYLAMEFEPATQPDRTKEIRKFRYVYHVTPSENVRSIMASGLEPRSESDIFQYPPRVHVINGNVTNKVLAFLGWQLFSMDEKREDGKYTVIRIRTDMIPQTVKFFRDPRLQDGYITGDKIPSWGMEIYGYIEYYSKKNYFGENILVRTSTDVLPD